MADNAFEKLSMQVDGRDVDIGQDHGCRRSRRRYGSWPCGTGTARPKRRRPRLPGASVPGLLHRREWPVWIAAQMRGVDECLLEAGPAVTESGPARKQQRASAGRSARPRPCGRRCAYASGPARWCGG